MSLTDARLFHVNVNCSDLERSRRFYTEGLGLGVGARTAPEESQPGAAFGLARARWDASILLGPRGYDGGAIDLLEWREPAPAGAPPARVFWAGFPRPRGGGAAFRPPLPPRHPPRRWGGAGTARGGPPPAASREHDRHVARRVSDRRSRRGRCRARAPARRHDLRAGDDGDGTEPADPALRLLSWTRRRGPRADRATRVLTVTQ